MSAPENLIYEFGPFLLEPQARRLSPDGKWVVYVPMKLTALPGLSKAAEPYIAVIFESADHPDPEDFE